MGLNRVAVQSKEIKSTKNVNNENLSQVGSVENSYIFIESEKESIRINFSNIIYLKASGLYTNIVTLTRSFTISENLGHVLSHLDSHKIVRCHRSFAINIDHIILFDDTTVHLQNGYREIELAISMGYRFNVINRLRRLNSN